MPKKFLFLLLVIGYWLLVIACLPARQGSLSLVPFVSAQAPTSQPTGQPTCDACGWCYSDPAHPNPKPPNHAACMTCLYNPDGTPKGKTYYTIFGCLSTEPGVFISQLLTIVFGIAGGTAFLSVLYGSGIILTSAGDPIRLQSGRETIISSLVGILLIIFSVFLLRVAGYDILRIPGFSP